MAPAGRDRGTGENRSTADESPQVISQLGVLTGKWVRPVLIAIGAGLRRPVEIRQRIHGLSDQALHDALRRMQNRGLVTKTSRPGVPPVAEYSLTAMGEEALKVARLLDDPTGQESIPDRPGEDEAERHSPREQEGGAVDNGERERPVSATSPSTARMYDYYLGGKDNFEADRVAAEQVLWVYPEIRETARANRAFMVRAVRCLAGRGVTQYIDLGTGIPTSPNVHEVARKGVPGARVVYVDNDPVVTAHNRALRDTYDGVISIDMDVRNIEGIRTHPEVTELIDFDQPIAVLLVSMLHFFDGVDAEKILTGIRSWMTPGSYLVLSTGTTEGLDRRKLERLDKIYTRAGARAVARTRDEIAAMFDGFELLQPGLTPISKWRADDPDIRTKLLGGVGELMRRPEPGR